MAMTHERADVDDRTGEQGPTAKVWDGHVFVARTETDPSSWGWWCVRCGVIEEHHAAADPERAVAFRASVVAEDTRLLATKRVRIEQDRTDADLVDAVAAKLYDIHWGSPQNWDGAGPGARNYWRVKARSVLAVPALAERLRGPEQY